jgi:hypothetical protein
MADNNEKEVLKKHTPYPLHPSACPLQKTDDKFLKESPRGKQIYCNMKSVINSQHQVHFSKPHEIYPRPSLSTVNMSLKWRVTQGL